MLDAYFGCIFDGASQAQLTQKRIWRVLVKTPCLQALTFSLMDTFLEIKMHFISLQMTDHLCQLKNNKVLACQDANDSIKPKHRKV